MASTSDTDDSSNHNAKKNKCVYVVCVHRARMSVCVWGGGGESPFSCPEQLNTMKSIISQN